MRRRTIHRGYTLVELGVVVVLTSLLLLGLVRWLVGVGASASVGIDSAADSRSLLVFDRMSKDLLALGHCQGSGVDASVAEVAPSRLTIVADVDGDASVETVVWRIDGDHIERGVAPMAADCALGEVTDWGVWLSGADDLVFSVISDGQELLSGTAGVCVTGYVTRCQVELLSVRIDAGSGSAEERQVFEIG